MKWRINIYFFIAISLLLFFGCAYLGRNYSVQYSFNYSRLKEIKTDENQFEVSVFKTTYTHLYPIRPDSERWTKEKIESMGELKFLRTRPKPIRVRYKSYWYKVDMFKFAVSDTNLLCIDKIQKGGDSETVDITFHVNHDGDVELLVLDDFGKTVCSEKLWIRKNKIYLCPVDFNIQK